MKTIFVFGSNREGRHGKGAALEARRNHGAIYGQAEGLQGNSYAIITKELRKHLAPVSLYEVGVGVNKFKYFVLANPEMEFLVSPIGCGLAGFKVSEIAPLFNFAYPWCHHGPRNITLPEEFSHHLLLYNNPYIN